MKTRFDAIKGSFCVKIGCNGEIQVLNCGTPENIWKATTKIIGCSWLGHVTLDAMEKDPDARCTLEMLVNEDGYAEYGDDVSKVNQYATFLYNKGRLTDIHYILGDVVLCVCIETEEGGDFFGISESFAQGIYNQFVGEVKTIKEAYPKPDTIPSPKVEIKGFDTMEEMEEYLFPKK